MDEELIKEIQIVQSAGGMERELKLLTTISNKELEDIRKEYIIWKIQSQKIAIPIFEWEVAANLVRIYTTKEDLRKVLWTE